MERCDDHYEHGLRCILYKHHDGPPKFIPPIVPYEEANKVQVGGRHYIDAAIQPWDYIAANRLGFFEGNIVKYVSRWREKDGLQDLEKARHYIDKLIEIEKGRLDEFNKCTESRVRTTG